MSASPGNVQLRTTNGSIHLNMPSGSSAQVDASTVHGHIKSDFTQDNGVESRGMQHLNFTMGAGAVKVEAATLNGSVRVSRAS